MQFIPMTQMSWKYNRSFTFNVLLMKRLQYSLIDSLIQTNLPEWKRILQVIPCVYQYTVGDDQVTMMRDCFQYGWVLPWCSRTGSRGLVTEACCCWSRQPLVEQRPLQERTETGKLLLKKKKNIFRQMKFNQSSLFDFDKLNYRSYGYKRRLVSRRLYFKLMAIKNQI